MACRSPSNGCRTTAVAILPATPAARSRHRRGCTEAKDFFVVVHPLRTCRQSGELARHRAASHELRRHRGRAHRAGAGRHIGHVAALRAQRRPGPNIDMIGQADLPAHHHKISQLRAAGNAGLPGDQAVAPDADVVRDLHQIVDLGPLPDDGVAGRAAVDRWLAPISTSSWIMTRRVWDVLMST